MTETAAGGADWTEDGKLDVDIAGSWDRLSQPAGATVCEGLIVQTAKPGRMATGLDPAQNFALGFVDAMQQGARKPHYPDGGGSSGNVNARAATEPSRNPATGCRGTGAGPDLRSADGHPQAVSGQQTVRVERVTAEEGGQAIVGTVERGGW